MSAKTRGRNTRNNLSTESPVTSKNASNSTTTKQTTSGAGTPKDSSTTSSTKPLSIIRTRHQAVQDANPGVEIKRRPTPGIRVRSLKYDEESSSPDNRTKSSTRKDESEDNDTPKKGRKKRASSVTKNTETPNAKQSPVPSSDKKTTVLVQKTTEVVKRGRGRPRKSDSNTQAISVVKQKISGTDDAIEISDDDEDSSKVLIQKKVMEKAAAAAKSPLAATPRAVPSILRKSPASKSSEATSTKVTRTVYSPKDLQKKASANISNSVSDANKTPSTVSPFKIVSLQAKPPVAEASSSAEELTTNTTDNEGSGEPKSGQTVVNKPNSTSEGNSTAATITSIDSVDETEIEKPASSTSTSSESTDMLDLLANACLSQSNSVNSVSTSTEKSTDSNSGKDSLHKDVREEPSTTSEHLESPSSELNDKASAAVDTDTTNESKKVEDIGQKSVTVSQSITSVGQVLGSKAEEALPDSKAADKNKLQEAPVLISPEAVKPASKTIPETPTTAEMAITQALANQFQRPQMDVISAVNTSLEQEHENTWNLAKMINLFIQWQNSDAMCWLDVVLSILVHSPTLKDIAKNWASKQGDDKNGNNSSIRMAYESQDSMTGIDDLKPENTDTSNQTLEKQSSDLIDDVTSCLNSMLDNILDDSATCDTPMEIDSQSKVQEGSKTDATKEDVDLIKIPSETTVSRSTSTQSTPIKDSNSAKAKLKFPIIITLIKAHEQAQYLLQNFLAKPFDKPEDQTIKGGQENSQSSIPAKSQTGAGIKIISPLVTTLNKQTDGGLPADALTHLGESIAKLEDVREVVWDILQPRLKCEKGKNDSPVFALPLLVRESRELKHIFSIDYSLVFHCTKCDYSQENKFVKALPSLPNVPDNFSMEEPAFIRNCFKCEAPGQRMAMKIHSMKDIAMLHFLQGLPRIVYDDLDFNFGEDRYSVTAVVQYKNNPDHFVSWIRNAHVNQWMECDDLKSPLCQFENAPPRIPPEQIHIVMWEKNVTDKMSPVLENSRTAGLLSTLLMSTRMVTLTSDGNNKILTTVPIQYTPVTPSQGIKRKAEDGSTLLPRSRMTIRTPKQNIVSKAITNQSPTKNKNIQEIIKQVKMSSESGNNPDQKVNKTKVVVMSTKKGNTLTATASPKAANDLKNVSIGGRIVKLTTQQLDAIRNSPGARVSIVGSEGTTTFSIKSVSNVPSAAHTKTTKDSADAKTQNPTRQPLASSGKVTSQTVAGAKLNPTAPKQQSLPGQQAQQLSQEEEALQGQQEQQHTTTNQQTILVTPREKNSLATQTTSNSSVIITSTSTSNSGSTPVTTSSNIPATQPIPLNSSNKLVTANPNRPCRIVVNSQGHVTAIANNDNSQIIPLTSDKLVNRALLEKFFSNGGSQLEQNNILIEQDSTFKIAPNIRSTITPKVQIKNSSGSPKIQPTNTAQAGSSATPVTPKIQIVSSTPKSQASSIMPKIQIAQHTSTATPSALQTMFSPQSASSLETAMAVDSITSPVSSGRGSKVGGRGTSVVGRGRGRGRGAISSKTSSPLTTPSTGGIRKVAIPTNNGHILLEIPPGRTPIECLRDPNIVKKLVKNTSSAATSISISSSGNLDPLNQSLAQKTTSQQLNSSPLLASKPNTSVRTISVPSSQESKIKELLAKHSLGKMSAKTVLVHRTKTNLPSEYVRSNQKSGQSDVLSAALFESGVASLTSTTQGSGGFNQSSTINSPKQCSLLSGGLQTNPPENSQGLDILMQGSVNQTSLLNAGLDTNSSNNSQGLDILMQGVAPETKSSETGQESHAMSILTGGITPKIIPGVSMAASTSYLSSQSSLQLDTQQMQTSVQIGRIGATSSTSKPIIISPSGRNTYTTSTISPGKSPQVFTIKSNGDNSSNMTFIPGQDTLLNSGSQSKKVIVKKSYPPSYYTSSLSQPQVITTVLNENKEVIINPQTIPSSPSVIKRKASSQLVDLVTKKLKTSEKAERSAQDIFSSIESGNTDQGSEMTNLRTIYFDPTDSNSQYIIGSSETVYDPSKLVKSPSEYLTTDVSNPMPSVPTDNNIFSKFGMTNMEEPSQGSSFQTLFDSVTSNENNRDFSSSLQSTTTDSSAIQGLSDTAAMAKTSQASTSGTDPIETPVVGDVASTNGNSLLDVAQESAPLIEDGQQNLVTSDGQQIVMGTDGQQIVMGTDGQHYMIGADGEPVAMGTSDDQQVATGSLDDQQITTPTDNQQIVMGDDGNQYMVGPDGQARQIFLGEDGQHYVMEADDQQLSMATDNQQTALSTDGQQVVMGGDGQQVNMGTDEQLVAKEADGQPEAGQQILTDADGQQIVLGPGEQQLVMGSDGNQYIVAMGTDGQQYLMETDPNQQYVMGTGPNGQQVLMTTGADGQLVSVAAEHQEDGTKPLIPGTESTQPVVLQEEVASVAENVEI